jgi:hypothetical protein
MFTEDLSVFFAEFGDDAQLAGQPVRGYYSDAYSHAQLGYLSVSGAAASFELPTAAVPAEPIGAAIHIAGKGAFSVQEHRPDGSGISALILERT